MGCSDLDSDSNIIKSFFFLFMKTCFEVDFVYISELKFLLRQTGEPRRVSSFVDSSVCVFNYIDLMK